MLRDELIGEFFDHTWALKESRAYYEGTWRPAAIGISTPPQMKRLTASVGYPRLYCDTLAERLEVQGFRVGEIGGDSTLWDWWSANNLDLESTLGHTDALVDGRAYVTISAPSKDAGGPMDVPVIRVEPASALYAKIDPLSRQVTEAVRVLADDDNQEQQSCTVYDRWKTVQWEKARGQWRRVRVIRHGLGVVPVVPLANRTRLSDLDGESEITPELRSVTDAASRITMNMQSTAEMMAVPQRILFGVSPDDIGANDPNGDGMGHFAAYEARILAFADPDAKATQFSAAELRNFTDALRELAKQAAAYTGLPPQYLHAGSGESPASAEAIRAAESRLVENAGRKAKVFGGAWEQVMRVAWMVMHPGESLPQEFYRLETSWRDPGTPTFAAKADAVTKLYGGGAGIIPLERARADLGYTIAEREEMSRWDKEADPFAGIGLPPELTAYDAAAVSG